ncbi:hypothetical protein CANTEDRAFT_135944 [Yamadazyma tenuis ATCC 10573]|uniref:Uncharacterized protein n=1 Tax=Candida tenuis (strain ATCC 10573 / BCRC 21748 / CBS 615 / JCM 9827 / NBRC 10315 / NRRL Y-1498 / VKM Y-70) TaxID=590646 RepID=G3BA48_CANTC|nr:uncharacterized protein CANTEDRAFT_135944 [Yamadazyma tenuis ATCC 10573]EGV62008.1 hypothetical protein CANTEDRAFT_135944 [Yamadazyma tenuis ATCC 10573]
MKPQPEMAVSSTEMFQVNPTMVNEEFAAIDRRFSFKNVLLQPFATRQKSTTSSLRKYKNTLRNLTSVSFHNPLAFTPFYRKTQASDDMIDQALEQFFGHSPPHRFPLPLRIRAEVEPFPTLSTEINLFPAVSDTFVSSLPVGSSQYSARRIMRENRSHQTMSPTPPHKSGHWFRCTSPYPLNSLNIDIPIVPEGMADKNAYITEEYQKSNDLADGQRDIKRSSSHHDDPPTLVMGSSNINLYQSEFDKRVSEGVIKTRKTYTDLDESSIYNGDGIVYIEYNPTSLENGSTHMKRLRSIFRH